MLRRVSMMVLIGLVTASAAAAGTARIRVSDRSPVVVRGTGFAAHERVRVTVRAGESATRRVVTGAAGAFLVRFPTVTIGSCAAYIVSAIGANGDEVILRVRAPECPSPLTP